MNRKPLKLKQEPNGKCYSAYFHHPLSKKTARIRLGVTASIAETNLKFLNAIFQHEDKWEHPPDDTPIEILKQWSGSDDALEVDADAIAANTGAGKVISITADAQFYKSEFERVLADNRKLRKMLEKERGKKLRDGPCPTLEQALETWTASYLGKDPDHMKIVSWDLTRFVKKFGEDTPVDDMENREKEISVWLDSLTTKVSKNAKLAKLRPARPISAGRKKQIRGNVLRFLVDSGATMNRKSVPTPKTAEIRKDRGAIKWLDADEMKAVSSRLSGIWKDAFDLQCAIGLRPSEIPTLKKADISGDSQMLTLSPVGLLTLKTGSRSFNLTRYPVAQEIIRRRSELKPEMLFPDETGEAWDLKKFYKAYNDALNAARGPVKFRLDGRVGRRTCASQLIRAGKSIEAVSALLGDDPNTVREHYAKVMPEEA